MNANVTGSNAGPTSGTDLFEALKKQAEAGLSKGSVTAASVNVAPVVAPEQAAPEDTVDTVMPVEQAEAAPVEVQMNANTEAALAAVEGATAVPPEAPWGFKKDGTPRSKPGRKQGTKLVKGTKAVKMAAKAPKAAQAKAKAPKGMKITPVKATPAKNKVAAVKAAPPKAPKVAKPVSKTAKVVAAEGDKKSYGQKGPKIKLQPHELNQKEAEVLRKLAGIEEVIAPKPITLIADAAFPDAASPQANSWTRNSLRRLVRAGLVQKTKRGNYTITKKALNAMFTAAFVKGTAAEAH